MKPMIVVSASEQVAARLRTDFLRGTLSGEIPGVDRIAEELGVNHKTVRAALQQLENEGLLFSQGPGRRRHIVIPKEAKSPSLRVAILEYEPAGKSGPLMIDLLHQLGDRGHSAFFTEKTLVEMRLDRGRVSGFVRQTEADAWIVGAGTREILQWFIDQRIPALALFGDCVGLPIAVAGLDYLPTMLELVRKLVGLGHRRIVFLQGRGSEDQRQTRLWRAVFGYLEDQGIRTGQYNLPQWVDSRDGFRSLLDSLFAHSPPTALVIEEIPHLISTIQFCGQKGIRVPQDLSLICLTASSDFDYCDPTMAHIRWDSRRLLRHVTQWVDRVARDREDRLQTFETTELVEGGSIGRVRNL